MRKIGKIVVTLVTVLLLVGIAACTPAPEKTTPVSEPTPIPEKVTPPPSREPTPTAEWGIIEIRVTDPPPAGVKSAVVYLTNIEVHKVSDNAGEWIPIIGAPASFDLMDVIGVEQVLGAANLTAGKFTQIRMDVTKVTGVTTDNVSYTAEVPGDKLKIVGAFNVGGGTKTVLTLDFDGERSLIRTGQGKFLFKPVVKLLISHGEKAAEGKKEETSKPGERGKPVTTGNATEARGVPANGGKGKKP